MKTYKALRALQLPATLHDQTIRSVEIGECFSVTDGAALLAGRYLANRVAMGDLAVVIKTSGDKT
jgi:hypothetical protein